MGYSVVSAGFASNNTSIVETQKIDNTIYATKKYANVASLATRWLAATSSYEQSSKFKMANQSISKFRLVFFPFELVSTLSDIFSSIVESLKTTFTKQVKRQEGSQSGRALMDFMGQGFMLSSQVLKGVTYLPEFTLGRVTIGARVERRMGFVSRYFSLIGSVVKIVTTACSIKNIKKNMGKSSLIKQQEVKSKLNATYQGLVCKITSLASAVLGLVAITVSVALIPWVIIALDTASIAIHFVSDVKKSYFQTHEKKLLI